jgi:hypothetical protein
MMKTIHFKNTIQKLLISKSIPMKTFVSILVLALAFVQFGVAQPDMFNYQTVVRNGDGLPISNQDVSFRMSVRAGSANGTVVYQEMHSTTTNEHGLVNFRIGDGSGSDNLSDVNWGSNSHYLQVEVTLRADQIMRIWAPPSW